MTERQSEMQGFEYFKTNGRLEEINAEIPAIT